MKWRCDGCENENETPETQISYVEKCSFCGAGNRLGGTVNGISQVRPWTRLLARLVDIWVWTVLVSITGLIVPLMAPFFLAFDGPAAVPWFSMPILATWIPVEALILAICGQTPGKCLFNIRVCALQGGRPKVTKCLERSVRVWLLGMAAGLPLLMLFAMAFGHARLKEHGVAFWDEAGGCSVRHIPMTPVKKALVVLVLVAMVLVTYSSLSG